MKIVEIKPRRKHITGILFDCEVTPADFGADTDAAGWLALDSELCDIKRLKIGLEITDEVLLQLVKESHTKRAKSRALWYVSRGDCPKKALFTKLKRAFPDYAAEAAVERLEELGLINDTEYAKRRLQLVVDAKKVSLKMAMRMLEAEGFSRSDVELAAEEVNVDTKKAILDLIDRKYKQKLSDKKGIDNTIAALMRKGYSYGEVFEALKEYGANAEFRED
jgi:regulatory protein